MPKPSTLTDFLLPRIADLNRGDLEARLKSLRGDGLYPLARRVDDRDAEDVTPRHLANVVLALIGTRDAIKSAAAVQRLAGLRWSKDSVPWPAFLFADSAPPRTLGDFIAAAIRNLSRGKGWPATLQIDAITAWSDEAAALVQVRDPNAASASGREVIHDLWFLRANRRLGQHRITEQRSMAGALLHVMAAFLRADADAMADAA